MNNVTVVGVQFGDEGKGKIVDWLAERSDVIVRFQGGHNAGHTLVINDKTFKLSLLPSGIVRPDKLSIIGNGVVLDPWALLEEIERVRHNGVNVTPRNLRIAENIPLILPLHGELDRIREMQRGESKLGTTGRGIGPAYEDKVARRAIRLCDLSSVDNLDWKLDELLMHHNALRCGMRVNTVDKAELKRQLLDIAPKILIYSDPVWKTLNYIQRMGSSILFEGAQAVMLDVDHGTYPFVTSSNTVAGQASIGSGLGPHMTGNVLGICKAYTTRVGSGPFPTELHDRIGKLLSENGKEFGTVTGRPRRCGWFDAVMVRQAIKLGGVKALALTKIDVLDSLDEIKVCIGYKHGSETLDYFPADPFIQSNIEPIYEIIPGWKQSIRGAKNISDIPSNAVKYIKRLEELIDIPVILVSTSPDRDDTIMIQDPFCN